MNVSYYTRPVRKLKTELEVEELPVEEEYHTQYLHQNCGKCENELLKIIEKGVWHNEPELLHILNDTFFNKDHLDPDNLFRHFHPGYKFNYQPFQDLFTTIAQPRKRFSSDIRIGDIILSRSSLAGKTNNLIIIKSEPLFLRDLNGYPSTSKKPGYYLEVYGNTGNNNQKHYFRIADKNNMVPNHILILRKTNSDESLHESIFVDSPVEDRLQNENIETEDYYLPDEEVYEQETDETLFNNKFEVAAEKGTTDYLNVSAVQNRSLTTGVFIPASYIKDDKVDMIIYFHGLYANGNKTNGIEYYWKNYSNIRECFFSSHRNGILIAPTLTSDPQQSTILFGNKNGFDDFVSACFKELKSKNYLSSAAEPFRIILAGHSAGGSPLRKILGGKNQLLNKVIECWGFDCLYNYNWEELNSAIPFYHYWAYNKSGTISGPGSRGESLQKTHPNLKNIAPKKLIYHQGIIEYAWLNEINNRSWLHDTNFTDVSASGTINVVPDLKQAGATTVKVENDLAKLTPEKRTVINIASGYPQITEQKALQLAISQNVTDKNDLTNLIFYKRHKDYMGRKLESNDPQSLKNEWIAIQKNIVAPFLQQQTANASSTPKPTLNTISSKPAADNVYDSSQTEFKTISLELYNKPITIVKENKQAKLAELKEAPSVFLQEIIRMALGKEAAEKWFNNFTRIIFLGRELHEHQYVHVELAKHLKTVEKEFAVKFGGANGDPKIAGDYLLGSTNERLAGSRGVSGTATYSYHMFGLAVDVNYTGNPFIQNKQRKGRNEKTGEEFIIPNGKITINQTLANASNLFGVAKVNFDYNLSYDTYASINKFLISYLTLIDSKNERKLSGFLNATTSNDWKGSDIAEAIKLIQADLDKLALSVDRWGHKDLLKEKGFLNFSKEFVEGVKLNWGAWYGDMMHFDMRTVGLGINIEQAKNKYISNKNAESRTKYNQIYG